MMARATAAARAAGQAMTAAQQGHTATGIQTRASTVEPALVRTITATRAPAVKAGMALPATQAVSYLATTG